MLNDATIADAKMLGLDHIVDCLTTNCDGAEIGLCPEYAPPALSEAISRCTLIIAKGMANFESLFERSDLPRLRTLWQQNVSRLLMKRVSRSVPRSHCSGHKYSK